jgi:hypothetical protein
MKEWKRDEVIALLSLIVSIVACLAAVVVIPQCQQLFTPKQDTAPGTTPGIVSTSPPATTRASTPSVTSILLTETPAPPAVTQTALPLTFDVFDDFLGPLGDDWGSIEGDISPVVLDGSLQVNYTSTGGYGGGGIPINNNDTPLKFLATELIVDDAEPESYTFLQVSLGIIDDKRWYAHFGIMHTGELFYASAPDGGTPDVEKTWPSKGFGNPNTLVVEWTDEDVSFYANDQLLHKVKAKDGGWWASLGVGAVGDGSSTNKFNWVGWSYRLECPMGVTCYEDDFSELDPAIWCQVPESGIEFTEGRLLITAPTETSLELHPCEHLDTGLRFVEVTLSIVQIDGAPGHAHAGLGSALRDDSYLVFQLDSAGNVVLAHGLFGESSQVDETVPLSDLYAPHTLRIEWTGDKALFFIDGAQLETQMDSDIYAPWFYITVNAWPGASIVTGLDNVKWGVISP